MKYMLGKFVQGKSASCHLSKEEKLNILFAGVCSLISIDLAILTAFFLVKLGIPVWLDLFLAPILFTVGYGLLLFFRDNR